MPEIKMFEAQARRLAATLGVDADDTRFALLQLGAVILPDLPPEPEGQVIVYEPHERRFFIRKDTAEPFRWHRITDRDLTSGDRPYRWAELLHEGVAPLIYRVEEQTDDGE